MNDNIGGNDLLMGSGIPSAKFETIGQVVTGTVIEEPTSQQSRDFDTGEPKTWDNGDPMMEVVVKIQCDPDPSITDDDGVRKLFLGKPALLTAIRGAVRTAKADGIHAGGVLQIKYTGDAAPKKKGYNGAKQFAAKYTPPAQTAFVDTSDAEDALKGSGLVDDEPPF